MLCSIKFRFLRKKCYVCIRNFKNKTYESTRLYWARAGHDL